MSKGSRPRPIFVDLEKFDENWDKIFGQNSTQSEADQKKEERILKELEGENANKPSDKDGVH